jgi:hypothetical protein
MAQGASRGPRVHIAARPQQHHAPQALRNSQSRFGAIWLEMKDSRLEDEKPIKRAVSAFGPPGGTPRELARSGRGGFDPQPKAELAQGEYKWVYAPISPPQRIDRPIGTTG